MPPLPAPDYLRADPVQLDPATGTRRPVSVVVDAMIWPLACQAAYLQSAWQDQAPLVPVDVVVRVEGLRQEPEEAGADAVDPAASPMSTAAGRRLRWGTRRPPPFLRS